MLCCGKLDDELKVPIISAELVCLIVCSCILSFMNKWLYFISLGIGVVYVLLTLCVLNKDCNEFCFLMAIFASINMCLVVSAFISYYFIVEYPLLFWGLVSWCVIMSVFWILFGCVFTNCQ